MEPAIWIVAGASVLSGFFALNSFALRSLSRARLEETFSGSRGRKSLTLLEARLPSLQLTLSLCRSLANLLLVAGMVRALGADTWGQLFYDVLWAGAIIAVLGVAIPHAWASYAGEGVLRVTFPVLMGLRLALFPITAVMRAFDLPVRRLSGKTDRDEETDEEEARQEILQAAADGVAEGAVQVEEVEMIESVIEFGNRQAAEIMTPRTDIFALPAETPWTEAAERIHQAGHTRVPIYEGDLDHIVGLVYAKDLLHHIGRSGPVNLATIARKPFFVPETKRLDDLLRQFKARKFHIAVVLDEYGGTAGLVTIEDVIEEIVGEIADEYDRAEAEQVRRISETVLEADGRLHVDELNDALDLTLPEDEDYDTVAGYAIAQLGYIPKPGETFTADGVEVTILEADERKISRLRVRKESVEENEP